MHLCYGPTHDVFRFLPNGKKDYTIFHAQLNPPQLHQVRSGEGRLLVRLWCLNGDGYAYGCDGYEGGYVPHSAGRYLSSTQSCLNLEGGPVRRASAKHSRLNLFFSLLELSFLRGSLFLECIHICRNVFGYCFLEAPLVVFERLSNQQKYLMFLLLRAP